LALGVLEDLTHVEVGESAAAEVRIYCTDSAVAAVVSGVKVTAAAGAAVAEVSRAMEQLSDDEGVVCFAKVVCIDHNPE
jgi:hypothetical protein